MESIKSTIAFWIVMPCSLIEVCQCFRGTYCLHLQSQKLSQARSRQQIFLLLLACLLASWLLAVHSSEISQNYWTTQCHILEDCTFSSDRSDGSLKYNGELELCVLNCYCSETVQWASLITFRIPLCYEACTWYWLEVLCYCCCLSV
jgi:hypothetical protein